MLNYFKREKVLTISMALAILSTIAVPPDMQYIEYIDLRVLVLLYCLMVIIKGFSDVGLFDLLVKKLTTKLIDSRALGRMLIFSCFFFSMLMTNDVALITFVPFAIYSLTYCDLKDYIIPIVVLQTIAANLGSMATPIGNPQNLYLFSISNMGTIAFEKTILPYTILSFVLLFISTFFIPKAHAHTAKDIMNNTMSLDKKHFFVYLVLFLHTVLTVLHVVDYIPLLAFVIITCIVVKRGWLLKQADFGLLFTFVFLFIFVGNIGRIDIISNAIVHLIEGREIVVSILASQILSNVPAAMLLSGFTDNISALIIGTNIGGLGTLIASMASLISFKLYASSKDSNTKKYLLVFTAYNIIGLIILVAFCLIYLE